MSEVNNSGIKIETLEEVPLTAEAREFQALVRNWRPEGVAREARIDDFVGRFLAQPSNQFFTYCGATPSGQGSQTVRAGTLAPQSLDDFLKGTREVVRRGAMSDGRLPPVPPGYKRTWAKCSMGPTGPYEVVDERVHPSPV